MISWGFVLERDHRPSTLLLLSYLCGKQVPFAFTFQDLWSSFEVTLAV